MSVKLGIILPCYNEEEVLPETSKRLNSLLDRYAKEGLISEDSFAVFVDDGSRDKTWSLIESLVEAYPRFKGLKLARNFGHQFALLSGLEVFHKKADCLLSIDVDLQDDIEVISDFVKEFKNGCEVVYGVREARKKDSLFKKWTAWFFYALMARMGVDIVSDHADYRLASQRALETLFQYREVNLFLRGLFPTLGYKTGKVFYKREERFAGESKYPFKKMLLFALEGITSFSIVPLRLISILGGICLLFSAGISAYYIVAWYLGNSVAGWASTVLPIYFLGSVQILSIGVIGEYVGKIYKESKQRPRYIVEKVSE